MKYVRQHALFLFVLAILFILMVSVGCFETADDPVGVEDAEETPTAVDPVQEVAALTGRGPAVRLVDHGMESTLRRAGHSLTINLFYTIEIDKPLDHNLLVLTQNDLYRKNDNILIEGDEILQKKSKGQIGIIVAGETTTGVLHFSLSLISQEKPATRSVLRVMPAAERVDDTGVVIGDTRAKFGVKDGEDKGIVWIPRDYDFKPYQIGAPGEIVHDLREEDAKLKR